MIELLALCAALVLFVPLAYAQSRTPDGSVGVRAEMKVDPPAVTPGGSVTFTLSLANPGPTDRQVFVEASLPAGFELTLSRLPPGAAYQVRSGIITWVGQVGAGSNRDLRFAGHAPAEPGTDGRLIAYAAVADELRVFHLTASGWAGVAPTAGFTYTIQADSSVSFVDLSQGTGPLGLWWEFGDGTVAAGKAQVHPYPGEGVYQVRLTVANPGGASTVVLPVSAPASTPPEVQPPPPSVLVSDETPAVGQPIEFRSLSEPIATVRWSFGDGTTSDDPNPVYRFGQPGTYTVSRIVGEGETAVQSSHTVVVDLAPEASIQSSLTKVSPGDLITFTASTSAGQVTSYFWDFGDGNTASHRHVAHSYGSPGDYIVTLAIGNDFGVALDTLSVHVFPYMVYLPWMSSNAGVAFPDAAAPTDGNGPDGQQPDTAPSLATQTPDDPAAQQLLRAINAERQASGLAPLVWSDQLARSSQHHSADMSAYGFTGHYGSNGSHPADRLMQASYPGDYAGEVTAWGFAEIADAVAWWMTSPPHRIIILSTVATEMGGGYSYNPNAPSVHYWTIDFGAQ